MYTGKKWLQLNIISLFDSCVPLDSKHVASCCVQLSKYNDEVFSLCLAFVFYISKQLLSGTALKIHVALPDLYFTTAQ